MDGGREGLHASAVSPVAANETRISQFSQTLQKTQCPIVEISEMDQGQFSQTLQTTTYTTTPEISNTQPKHNLERYGLPERTRWVVNVPEAPGLWFKLKKSIRENVFSLCLGRQTMYSHVSVLRNLFPILLWYKNYNATKLKKDFLAGLTLASICIPQSIGYAALAKIDPQYGLYTSVIPPLIYSVMGSSRELAIGPVAVVSLLLSSMIEKLEDPVANPIAYRRLVFTATFFAGVYQAAFSLLRLGFLVDFLSHAASVGFIAGAAILIGLQQLKGLLGVTNFTNKTDIISVLRAVLTSVHHPWNPHNLILGCSFLSFILITKLLGRRNKKLFWLATIAPLLSVIFSTLIVFLTRADKHGVKIVQHIKRGLNTYSVRQLQFNSPYTAELAKIGLIAAVVALTEAISVGRSFASIRGYHLDGNKEMLAMGIMNIAGSATSCYIATGSFSRTAVNFSAGCETPISNVVMAITVLISLELLTRLLYFTPIAILASIIISALPGLIDLNEVHSIWKVDKLDFLACIGAFFGVLFASVEVGLLLAVAISFARVILNSIQAGTETLGRLPGSDIFADVNQYPMAVNIPGVLIIKLKSSLLCFPNANSIRERIMNFATKAKVVDAEEHDEGRVQLVVFEMSNLLNMDTSGMTSLEELHNNLASHGIELAIANPRWQVIHKLKRASFWDKIKGKVFLTVGDAMDSCLANNMA